MTDTMAEQLADEFQRLGQTRPGDNAQPVATFSAKPWEAYTLIAALQGSSRHPGLSDTQREMVLGFAHQVANQLVNMARAVLGTQESAIETTIGMGFDPQFDVTEEREAPDPDYGPEDNWDDEPEDSHILGERRINYVEPSWIHLSTDPEDADLSKCACCSRFFVQAVPIRLFQDLGERVVLGFEVCEECAPTVLSRMQH
jgi:hypothetical protein